VALVVAAAVDSGVAEVLSVAVATVVQLSHQKQFWLMLEGLLWSRFTIRTQCLKWAAYFAMVFGCICKMFFNSIVDSTLSRLQGPREREGQGVHHLRVFRRPRHLLQLHGARL
jgi:hypothetical protein